MQHSAPTARRQFAIRLIGLRARTLSRHGDEALQRRREARDAIEIDFGEPARGQRALPKPRGEFEHGGKGDVFVALGQGARASADAKAVGLLGIGDARQARIEHLRRRKRIRFFDRAQGANRFELIGKAGQHLLALGVGVADARQRLRPTQVGGTERRLHRSRRGLRPRRIGRAQGGKACGASGHETPPRKSRCHGCPL